MRKLLFTFLILFATNASAQNGAVTVTWDANPSIDNVITYSLQLDNQNVVSIPAGPACNPTVTCQYTFTSVTSGSHVISVAANNEWGSSPPTSVTFATSVPGKVTNVRVKKAS